MDRWLKRSARIVRITDAMEAVDRGWLQIGDGISIAENVTFLQPSSSNKKIKLGDNVSVDFGCVIHEGVSIKSGARINSNVRIERDCKIGENTFIGHGCVLRPNTIIGDNCTIGHLTVFEGDSNIGDDTLIHAQCHITKGVTIGKKVFIAPLFVGANDPMMCHARRHIISYEQTPYIIEDGVRIAIGVSILPGVRIGKNAMIGAHALVTRDVPPNAIMRGVPARVAGEVDKRERLCKLKN